tara:strand:- start:33 stop:308 length:276 start_codon:yes stop_codon:yes gene_type:complete
MRIKYTTNFLSKLEDLFSESSYILRYEKGNFQSGFCILNDSKIAIINKYFPLEGKINSLIEIIRSVELNPEVLGADNKKIFHAIRQNELKF